MLLEVHLPPWVLLEFEFLVIPPHFEGGRVGLGKARGIGPFKCTSDLSGFNNKRRLFVSTQGH